MATATTSGTYTAVATIATASTSGSYEAVRSGDGFSLFHHLGGGVLVKADLYRWDGTSLLRINSDSPPVLSN